MIIIIIILLKYIKKSNELEKFSRMVNSRGNTSSSIGSITILS